MVYDQTGCNLLRWLLEQSKIQLEDLVCKYLPEFSNLSIKKGDSPIDDVEDQNNITINLFLYCWFSQFLADPVGKIR